MRVDDKLGEAAFFLREMERVQHHRQEFIYELSAFTSACKTVSYYLRAEYGDQWYKLIVSRVERGEFQHIGNYLRKRDANVHQEPLDVLRRTEIAYEEQLPDDTRFWINGDQFGNIQSLTTITEDPDQMGKPIAYSLTHRYYFLEGEATGQDILNECKICLHELSRIVLEARQSAISPSSSA